MVSRFFIAKNRQWDTGGTPIGNNVESIFRLNVPLLSHGIR